MMNNAATKEHAITELLTRIHIHRDHTYGFGDAMNDVPLFKAVHTKIAVGNAAPALKEMADEIIPQVSEDGFAQYLERLV
jgi:hydroxymethylpyrimidine pyrophosphatase-like HAD family hydrolase